MSINGLTKSTIHPMHKVRARINFVTSRTFVCRKRRGEPNGLFFRGTPPNTPVENVMPQRYCLCGIWMV